MRVELSEYERVAGITLTQRQARSLQSSRAIGVSPDPVVENGWELRAAQYVGIVQAEDVEVRITPKVPVDRLMFLLTYARDKQAWHALHSDLTEAEDLFESVAFAFTHHAELALEAGVLQGYVTVDDALPTVRGRIREADQMRRQLGLMVPVEVTFDDYTMDIPENRWLRSAALQLLRLPMLSRAIVRRLRHIVHRLDAVGDLTRLDLTSDVAFTRLNDRYRPAIRLAQLIVDAGSLEFALGERRATTFLFDMNKVFEDFVTAALSRELERIGGHIAPQDRHYLDTQGHIEIKPDVVWWVHGRCAAVVDVKYKATAVSEIPNADAYQALAYSLSLDVRPAYLVYASGNEEPDRHEILHSDLEVVASTLDLGLPPVDLLDVVSSLAARIADESPARTSSRTVA